MKWPAIIVVLLTQVFPALGQPGLGIKSVLVSPRYEPQPTEPSGQIFNLINNLGSPEPEQRRQALASLVEMRPDVEAELRWAIQREAPAVTFPFQPDAAKSNRFLLKSELRESQLRRLGIE